MVPDPYKILGLPHSASPDEIKRAYRSLAMKLHPDRLTRLNASPEDMRRATAKFASVSSAYALLSNPSKKREYDHIYKYGGFDEEEKKEEPRPSPHATTAANTSRTTSCRPTKPTSKGIGYAVHDPIAFILSNGKVKSTTIAGIQIPSRFGVGHNSSDGGFRVAFSNGQVHESPEGTKKYVAKTTQFVRGKKFSRVETTTIHPDGRTELIIEGDDYVERRYSQVPIRKRAGPDEDELTHQGDDLPWYMSAWSSIRENLTSCYNPSCGTISVR